MTKKWQFDILSTHYKIFVTFDIHDIQMHEWQMSWMSGSVNIQISIWMSIMLLAARIFSLWMLIKWAFVPMSSWGLRVSWLWVFFHWNYFEVTQSDCSLSAHSLMIFRWSSNWFLVNYRVISAQFSLSVTSLSDDLLINYKLISV